MQLLCMRKECSLVKLVSIRIHVWGWGGIVGDKERTIFSGDSSGSFKLLWEDLCLIGNMKHKLAMAEKYLYLMGLLPIALKCCKEKANTFWALSIVGARGEGRVVSYKCLDSLIINWNHLNLSLTKFCTMKVQFPLKQSV